MGCRYCDHVPVARQPNGSSSPLLLLRGKWVCACIDLQALFLSFFHIHFSQESVMGKYFLGWLLGVPAVVLVGIYVVTHVL